MKNITSINGWNCSCFFSLHWNNKLWLFIGFLLMKDWPPIISPFLSKASDPPDIIESIQLEAKNFLRQRLNEVIIFARRVFKLLALEFRLIHKIIIKKFWISMGSTISFPHSAHNSRLFSLIDYCIWFHYMIVFDGIFDVFDPISE